MIRDQRSQLCARRSIGGRYRPISYPPSSAIFTFEIGSDPFAINKMSPSKTPKRVAFNCKEQVIISDMDEGEENCQSSATLSSNEEEETPPPVESNNNNSSSSSSSSSSSFSSSTIAMRKELLRLESLVRCHVQHQWHLSIENYRCPFH